jgi:hypothetical protein
MGLKHGPEPKEFFYSMMALRKGLKGKNVRISHSKPSDFPILLMRTKGVFPMWSRMVSRIFFGAPLQREKNLKFNKRVSFPQKQQKSNEPRDMLMRRLCGRVRRVSAAAGVGHSCLGWDARTKKKKVDKTSERLSGPACSAEDHVVGPYGG